MSNYRVSIPYIIYVDIEVEADDEESAVEEAYDLSHISNYVGNGGSDKLVGVCSSQASIDAPEGYAEGDYELRIEVNEI